MDFLLQTADLGQAVTERQPGLLIIAPRVNVWFAFEPTGGSFFVIR